MYFGAADGASAASMFEDLVELFEQGAADGTPIRGIVGDDPVEFADTFLENYAKGGWVTKEQDRLAERDRPRRRGRGGDPLMTTPTTGPVIQVLGLTKRFKDLEVLRGVDFEVERGSIFALLGSNGAGKTTVVKVLATLLRADAGTVRVNGFDVATQATDVRESISLTGQFAAVDDILTGRENLVLVREVAAPEASRHHRR